MIPATAAVADPSAVTASAPRVVFSDSRATSVVERNGTNWRQLNECTTRLPDVHGNRLLALFVDPESRRQELLLLPAAKELVGECDNGPSDPPRRKYRLRVPGAQMTSLYSIAWSPDGRRILAVELRGPSPVSPYRAAVFNSNGKGYRLVGPADVTTAAWSPTGNRIVYGHEFKVKECPEFEETGTIGLCDRNEIAVMNADGSAIRTVYAPPQVDTSALDDLPANSPFRKLKSTVFSPFAWYAGRIFLTAHEPNEVGIGSERIAVINENGTGFRYLTPRASNLTDRPALSPDGKEIAVIWEPGPCSEARGCRGERGLYLLASTGGPQRKLKVRQPLVSQTCGQGSRPVKCGYPYEAPDGGYAGVTWTDGGR
jgi:hypothetical protein